MLLIVSAKSHEETVPCNYNADTIVNQNTARLTSGAQGTKMGEPFEFRVRTNAL